MRVDQSYLDQSYVDQSYVNPSYVDQSYLQVKRLYGSSVSRHRRMRYTAERGKNEVGRGKQVRDRLRSLKTWLLLEWLA